MQNHFGLLDTDVMPMFMIIALDIVITWHFCINCSAVICSPTVIISILREASSETYGPRVYFPSIKSSTFHHTSFRSTIFQSFTFQYINQKYLLYLLSSLSDLTFASNREGIDNPFIALGASWCLFVQLFGGLRVVSYWIDTLVLKG